MALINASNYRLISGKIAQGLLMIILIISVTAVKGQITGTMKDPRDGQLYNTVRIGEQWWMAQNLNYKVGKSFFYLRDSSFAKTYGRLYYYEDAMKACPSGWHLPGDAEWTKLTDYLGGEDVAASAMKKTDGGQWDYFGKNEINSSGFSALPGGCHSSDWEFGMMRFLGFWWTSTAVDETSAWNRHMECGQAEVFRNTVKKSDGLSVRCVKN